jgi:hypothetical protein
LDTWDVGTGITSLSAAAISSLDVVADYLGPVTVRANRARGLAGDITASTFTLTGSNPAAAGAFGLKSLTADGVVMDSAFNVLGGNAGPVAVGRFFGSHLYVGYTPGPTFDSGGTFDPAGFRLAGFRTTGRTLGNPGNALNWAFAGSEVAAASIGPVTLSGLRTANPGNPFGIKFQSAGGPVRALSADVALPPVLAPGPAAVAGDFFLIDAA